MAWAPLAPVARSHVGNLHAAVRPVLIALAVGASPYWQHELGGIALCVLDGHRNVLCRASPSTDGKLGPLGTDAVIEMSSGMPRAHSAVSAGSLMNIHQVEPFCCAAIQAAQSTLPALRLSWHNYACVTGDREKNLNWSMSSVVQIFAREMDQIAARVIDGKQGSP